MLLLLLLQMTRATRCSCCGGAGRWPTRLPQEWISTSSRLGEEGDDDDDDDGGDDDDGDDVIGVKGEKCNVLFVHRSNPALRRASRPLFSLHTLSLSSLPFTSRA